MLSVSGTLTFDSVASVYSEAQSLLSSHTGVIDLAEVTLIDSAGLALLLEWQSAAKKRGCRLSFVNTPDDLLRLADLSESTGLLGLTARQAKVES